MLFDSVADVMAGETGLTNSVLHRVTLTRLTGLRLLVVEDNMMNQQVAFELLSNEGAQVACANNGRLGVAAILSAKPPFDAVLMDIQMPDIDGYAATAEIRRHASFASLPIIAMTANVMTEDKVACLTAGMNDHIGKPIELDVLVMTILRHCPRISADGDTKSLRTISEVLRHPPPVSSASLNHDFDEALRKLGGNKPLFLNMTNMFIETASALAADLQRHLLGGEKVAAARLLHTLQGTAGTVGARRLGEYALQLEQQLRFAENARSLAFSVNEFDAFVRQSCNALRAYADVLGANTQTRMAALAATPDNSAITRLLDELDVLMRGKNMRAVNIFEDLRAKFGSILGERLVTLEQAMNGLNFPLSLERSKILRESLQ
jgi:CheY-like chemotaxis protein